MREKACRGLQDGPVVWRHPQDQGRFGEDGIEDGMTMAVVMPVFAVAIRDVSRRNVMAPVYRVDMLMGMHDPGRNAIAQGHM